jgi:DNA uptake protein ComE-like DNA-binding protein
VRVSRASAIDLAGSEDNRRTDNNKERLVESSAINKSLFVLAQCVEAISKKQSRVPYRESKMTRILSLGQNNGNTIMILNLAPVRSYHLDTLSSLNFANRTKKIEVAEVENEPVYWNTAKPLAATTSIGGATITRQPLRPLNSAHNANMGERETAKKPGDKPVKAFSVYSDARKSNTRASNISSQNQGIRRTETHTRKRAAEPGNTFGSRPSKTFRPADRVNEPGLSKASIEALISQRIDEKLAEKALQDASASAPALSAELQRRLDDLEHRIDAKDDDGKSQGLQFLMMAKQHQVRGEELSTLRMYQLALPYFPENEKLKNKIQTLEDRIKAKKGADPDKSISASSVPTSQPPPLMAPLGVERKSAAAPAQLPTLMAPLRTEKQQAMSKPLVRDELEDEDFAPVRESDHDESYASDSSFRYKKKPSRGPKKSTKKLPVFCDSADVTSGSISTSQPGEQTPRTTHLLRIINSRDINQIRALKGVGTKRADAIVSCLVDMDDDEVHDLESLASLKGVGGRTVENMRMGLSAGGGF